MNKNKLLAPKESILGLTCGLVNEDKATLDEMFGGRGLKLIHTNYIGEALTILLDRNVGVIVVDKQMPDKSWVTFLKVSPHILIVLVDRLADEEMWRQALAEGAHDMVRSRPFDRAVIEHAVIAAWHHWLQSR